MYVVLLFSIKFNTARKRGLIALHSKMADENICVDFQEQEFTVKLKPEDIAGASVNDNDIGKLSVNQLKFWLKCRRMKQGGN